MGASHVELADEGKQAFQDLQRKRTHRYIIFKIDEKLKKVVVDKTGGPVEDYQEFTAALPEDDCRYAVYDFDFVTAENCQKSKIFFISWSPTSSRIRSKMLYATSKEKFRKELEGVHVDIQATDASEVDLTVLRGRAK